MYNCHYQFKVSLSTICGDSQKWGLYVCPPFSFKEHDLMLCHFSLAALKGIMPSLHNQCRYLSVGRSILHQNARPMALHSNMRATCPFHSPISVGWPCLPWPSSVNGSIPLLVHYLPASMGIRCHPSALHMCSSRGLQPNHFTCGLHPSSVDAPVDVHDPSHNFPFFHPREALLVGCQVTALPCFSCGVLSSSPPKEVVLHGVGLVHLSHVWWLPIH